MVEPADLAQPGDFLRVTAEVAIPMSEIRFRFSRSSGPGGQHVNRSETRVELLFDVDHSHGLTDEQKERIKHCLGGYVDGEGVLRVVSSATRSQAENRADAVLRFESLLRTAFRRRKRRIATRPSAVARARRVQEKHQRSEIKAQRRRVGRSDYE